MADHRKDMTEIWPMGQSLPYEDFETWKQHRRMFTQFVRLTKIELNFSKDLSSSLTVLETLGVNKTVLEHVRM